MSRKGESAASITTAKRKTSAVPKPKMLRHVRPARLVAAILSV